MTNFIGNRNKFFAFSATFIVLGMLATMFFGINLDIQFKGGAIMTYSHDGTVDADVFKSTVEGVLGESIKLQVQQDVISGKENLVISCNAEHGISSDTQLKLSDTLKAKFPDNNITPGPVNVVDPTIGREFLMKSIVAVAFASLLMIVYIAIRFKKMAGWSAGVVAVIALAHDILAVFFTFIVFKMSINDNFIAVVLTILGYSLNDTIVIYDRIRENQHLLGNKMSTSEIVNKSINQSLSRSITTTVTTVAAMLVVTVVAYVYKLDSMFSFSFPLIIGMASGLYSSLFISPALWTLWQDKKAKKSTKTA